MISYTDFKRLDYNVIISMKSKKCVFIRNKDTWEHWIEMKNMNKIEFNRYICNVVWRHYKTSTMQIYLMDFRLFFHLFFSWNYMASVWHGWIYINQYPKRIFRMHVVSLSLIKSKLLDCIYKPCFYTTRKLYFHQIASINLHFSYQI